MAESSFPCVPLFSSALFAQALAARDAYAREHPDCRLVLRLLGGDPVFVDQVRATSDEGLVCSCVERGREPGGYPLAVIPWSALLRVDLIDRLPWAGTPGFRPA